MLSLEQEFEQIKFDIKVKNWYNSIKKLMQYYKDLHESNGLLMSDDEAFDLAQNKFREAKLNGTLDELNFLNQYDE